MTNEIDLLRFPAEIICTIFSFLEFHERVRLTATCRSWRHLLLNWPAMWETLDDPECDFGKDLIPFKPFIKHDAIKHLDIQKLNVDQQSRALSFMAALGSTSLKTLRLSFKSTMLDTLEQVLQLSSHTIMQLCIRAQAIQCNNECILARILQHCPNIKAIDYQQPSVFGISSERHKREEPDKLCLPHLESVQVKGVLAAKQVLDTLDTPNLKRLSISINSGNISFASQWPQLRMLRLVGSSSQAFKNIPITPCLETLFISPILATDAFLDAIGNLPYLQELHLESRNDGAVCSEQGIIRMLRGCRRLQKLSLNCREWISDNVLDAVGDIATTGQLTCLVIAISITKSDEQHPSSRPGALFTKVMGVWRLVSRIAGLPLDHLGLWIYDGRSADILHSLRDKLGDQAVINGRNGLGHHRELTLGVDGRWRIQKSNGTAQLLPSACDYLLRMD